MRVLIITQYFPPETGAAQGRLFDLGMRLQDKGMEVSVLTTMPSYPGNRVYEGYTGLRYLLEEMDGLKVHRTRVYLPQGTHLAYRLVNYLSFVFLGFIVGVRRVGKADLIVCESPPLFLGFSAVVLKWIKRARLVFNVSDLWPESALRLGLVKNRLLIGMSYGLERWIYRHADFITCQTQGIVADISHRYPKKSILWYPNGVDAAWIDAHKQNIGWRAANGLSETDFLVYFGGLMGYAQGLDVILDAAMQTADNPRIKYILMGEGPDRKRLEFEMARRKLRNVLFMPGVTKNAVISVIQEIDAAVIPLKKIDLFLGAIPSKIFEILYLKKPVLLGVAGEAKSLFIDQAQAGLAFEPENGQDLARKIISLFSDMESGKAMGQRGSLFVAQYFDRQQSFEKFLDFISGVSDTRIQ